MYNTSQFQFIAIGEEFKTWTRESQLPSTHWQTSTTNRRTCQRANSTRSWSWIPKETEFRTSQGYRDYPWWEQ